MKATNDFMQVENMNNRLTQVEVALASATGYNHCMVYQKQIQIRTSEHGQMRDLTDDVARVVGESRVKTGIAHVFNIGSTGAVGTIEFEPGLEQDLPEMLDRLMPPSRDYGHER